MKKNKSNFLIFAMFSIAIIITMGLVSAFANPTTVNLGEAGKFAVLSSTAISDSTPTGTVITGDITVSPADATTITGLACSEIIGTVHVASAGGETLACQTIDPLYLTPTILEYETAYTDATGRAYDATISTALDELTYTHGVYTAANLDLSNDNNVTLDCEGDANGVFIFMTAGHLNIGTNAHVNLIGGCQSGNIFWAVAGTTDILGGIGTESTLEGTILAGQGTTEISLGLGSTVNGRLMSDKTISLLQNIITIPTDAINPLIVYTTGTEANNSNKAQTFVYVNVSITETNFKNVTFNLYNSSKELINTTNLTDDNRSVNFTSLTAGVYYYNVTVYDQAGNFNSTDTYKITLDAIVVDDSVVASSSGGGGGGSGYCSTKWNCTGWSTCADGTQTRTCSYPTNWCAPKEQKPAESQSCLFTVINKTINPQTNATVPSKGISITGNTISEISTAGKVGLIALILAVLAGIIFALVKIFSKKKI